MVHSLGSYANPVEIFFKISPDHLNIDMSWHVRMIETIKQPLETLLMTPWKWPIWVILHCKNCTSENFRAEGGHHFFFTFFGFPSLILTIRSYPENFIASRKCKVTPSINTVAAWVKFKISIWIWGLSWHLNGKVCFLNERNKLRKYEPNVHHSNIGSSRQFPHHTKQK